MARIAFLKKHFIPVLALIVFGTWIMLLSIIGANASPSYSFTDAWTMADVSAEYSLEASTERYFLEPLSGLDFLVVDNLAGVFIAFLLVYVVIRFLYLICSRFLYKNSKRFKAFAPYMRRIVNFYPKYFSLVLAIGLAILGIVYLAGGFLAVNNIFNDIVQAAVIIWPVMLLLKFVHTLMLFINQTSRLKVKRVKPWKSLSKKKPRYWAHKVPETIFREARYGFFALLGVVVLVMMSFSTQVPTRKIQTDLQPDEFLCDFHCHTTRSDGWLSPQERIEWYNEQGISIVAITDHENTIGALEAQAYVEKMGYDITVLVGQEYTHYEPYVHLNIFGLEEVYVPESLEGYPGDPWGQDQFPNQMNISDMIDDVKSKGGWVIVNHYSYDPEDDMPFQYQDFVDWGVDGFEGANGGRRYGGAIDFCLDYRETTGPIILLGTTDEHLNDEITSFTRIKLPDPSNRTTDAIFQALLDNTTTQNIIVDKYARRIQFPEALESLEVAEDFLNYMLGLDTWQRLSWFLWSFAGFGLFMGVYTIVKQLNAGKIAAKIEVDPRRRSVLFKLEKRKDEGKT